ncbi:MAG TPA: C1 family peptidase [Pyrinomonadaceae bacterium]|nr:C1 family peptidase [Pyrinomonadaceae bacterium]
MPTKKAKNGDDLQTAIYNKGFSWEAAPTELSTASVEEQKAHLGLEVDRKELQATERAIAAAEELRSFSAASFTAPTSVDWRNNGGNFVTSVKNQGGCGACVSFATLATIESRFNIKCQTPGQNRDYSEAFLFYCGCGQCCGNGWNFPPALDFCKNKGILNDTQYAYTPNNQPCPSGLPAPTLKIDSWSAILPVADRKDALARRGPLVAGMAVYQDFYAYKSGVYKHVTGGFIGYHAISCIGYDDTQKCWICKNSWGTGWGEAGFFKIAYGDCGIDSQFAMYEPNVTCPGPAPNLCDQYLPVLRQVLAQARTNPQLRLCLRYYVCGKLPRPYCTIQHITIARSVIAILQKCPQYRAPWCAALG